MLETAGNLALAARLLGISRSTPYRKTAQDLLHEGKLEEARKIYDRLIASDEGNVDRAAQDHFSRATIFALQFRMADALVDYAKAYQYRPDNPRYAWSYAKALRGQKDYPKAEAVLQGLLPQERSLAAQNPAVYRPDLAKTLANLGVLYGDTHRFAEAEAADREAAGIERALAAQNPAAYREDLQRALSSLAFLYHVMHRESDANVVEAEAR